MTVVSVVEKSKNSKTGIVSATYAPIQSCPKTCPFVNSGCYAQYGYTAITLNRINRICGQNKLGPADIAKAEANQILKLTGKNNLRLHVTGDCRTSSAAKEIASATKIYSSKYNSKVWTYTHSWRTIPREVWGNISVLASCETKEDILIAMGRGYAASVIKQDYFSKKIIKDNVTYQPCRHITYKIQCNDCKLCMRDKYLLRNRTVVCFFPHGAGANKIRRHLEI